MVDKSNYRSSQIVAPPNPEQQDLTEGQALLKIDKFAYTSNNTTYAVVGDLVGYWKFFPIPEEGYGTIPCWGFASVIASKCPDIYAGSRYYGFFPMGSYLIVSPGSISERGFTDIMEHRVHLPVIYNQYIATSHDPLYSKEREDYLSLFRPLFTTSFLIHDQYVQNDFYSADQMILTSASSKTALGLASCLSHESVKTIGLTSSRNIEMVKNTGYYDEVYDYDHITDVNTSPSSYIDFAGNHAVQLSLQKHLKDELKYVCKVGMVHWEKQHGQEKLPMDGEFFFAPTYATKRIKEMGIQEFGRRLSIKFDSFVTDSTQWIQIKNHKGGEALSALHVKMTNGDIDATAGHIIHL